MVGSPASQDIFEGVDLANKFEETVNGHTQSQFEPEVMAKRLNILLEVIHTETTYYENLKVTLGHI